MAPLKVLISGAGIAGNALAFWLTKLGHDVTVIERFASLRTNGLQIDLRGHGIEVLKRMGLEPAFRAKCAPEQGMQVVDKRGKQRAFFPANKTGQGTQNFTSEYEIMRGDLCQLLFDASKAKTKFVFGDCVERFKNMEDGVEVRFKDGKKEIFDLLVGADGVGSQTRKMMLGPDAPDAFFPLHGLYIAYFTIPRPIQPGEEYIATTYIATGQRGVMTRRQNSDELQIYLGGKSDSEALNNAKRGDEQKAVLTELFQGAGWLIDDFVKGMQGTKNFYMEKLGLVKMDSWSKGRVVLLGDAGYCPSVNTGMGTTSAMVGTYILAGEIGKHYGQDESKDALMTALKSYETKFRPFMDNVQKGVLEDKGGMPSSEFGIAVMNIMAGILSFLRVNIASWMMKEDVKGWDLPDYEELRQW